LVTWAYLGRENGGVALLQNFLVNTVNRTPQNLKKGGEKERKKMDKQNFAIFITWGAGGNPYFHPPPPKKLISEYAPVWLFSYRDHALMVKMARCRKSESHNKLQWTYMCLKNGSTVIQQDEIKT